MFEPSLGEGERNGLKDLQATIKFVVRKMKPYAKRCDFNAQART